MLLPHHQPRHTERTRCETFATRNAMGLCLLILLGASRAGGKIPEIRQIDSGEQAKSRLLWTKVAVT